MNALEVSKELPIGQKVKYYPIEGEKEFVETTIISSAWALGHGEVVIKIKDRHGGVCASHIEKIEEENDNNTFYPNCGTEFDMDNGIDSDNGELVCSDDCAEEYGI